MKKLIIFMSIVFISFIIFGADWEILSTDSSSSGRLIVAPDNTIYTLMFDENNENKLTIQMFNKGIKEWETVGNTGFTTKEIFNFLIDNNGKLYLALYNPSNNDRMTVMTYNETTHLWEVIGDEDFAPRAKSLLIDNDGLLILGYDEVIRGC